MMYLTIHIIIYIPTYYLRPIFIQVLSVTVLACPQHPDHQPDSGTNPAKLRGYSHNPSRTPAINPNNRPTAHLPGLLGLHITITQVSRSTPPFHIRSLYYYGIPSFSPDYS
jgi:hypothetical protein